MSEKMLVTQALDERDLLVKKISDKIEKASFVDTIKPNEEKCCCPHELSLTCLHESSSDCLTFCHQSLQGCRLTTGGNKDYVVMVPSISCSTTYLII